MTLRGVTKQFGTVTAVNSFSLDVADGELLVLLGPSGCGKSTILRLISGLDNPSGGEILIGERQVERLSPKDRDVAMVFQNYALYPHMSVYDNMAFGLKMRKTPRPEIQRRVGESAELLDITRLLQRKPGQLSGGERQRVALARAIVREPQVFLMDEPLSNLDAQLRVQTRAEIVKLQRRLKATVIYVTHDQTEAMTMADRVAVMRSGVLQQVAPPQQLYDLPANRFVGGFIGNPGMNFLAARVATLKGELSITTSLGHHAISYDPGTTAPALGSEIVVGVRPEDLSLTPQQQSDGEVPPATVDLVEPLGSEKLVHLAAGEDRLVARVDPRASISAEDRVQIQLKAERSHLFDAATGLRMGGVQIVNSAATSSAQS